MKLKSRGQGPRGLKSQWKKIVKLPIKLHWTIDRGSLCVNGSASECSPGHSSHGQSTWPERSHVSPWARSLQTQLLRRANLLFCSLFLPRNNCWRPTHAFNSFLGPSLAEALDYLETSPSSISSINVTPPLFFHFGATAPILALAYLNKTLRFTSVF
jgi:hypothetical protein